MILCTEVIFQSHSRPNRVFDIMKIALPIGNVYIIYTTWFYVALQIYLIAKWITKSTLQEHVLFEGTLWRQYLSASCVLFFFSNNIFAVIVFFLILCEFHRHEFAGLWFNIPKYTNLLLFDLFVVWIGRMRSRAHLRSVAIFCSIYKLNIFKTYHVCDL